MALRRDRKDDAAWVTLPVEGFAGEVPDFPLSEADSAEVALWDELWRKPQGVMWSKLELKYQVAAYVRTYLAANAPGAVSGLKTVALSMEAQLGLSTDGFAKLRWKFSEDELASKREAPVAASGARSRLAAINERP